MQKLIIWIVVLPGTYFLGFYMGLQHRSNENPETAIKKHLKEMQQRVQDRSEELWKIIKE